MVKINAACLKHVLISSLAAFLFVCTFSFNSFAQPGVLDQTFGNKGKVITPLDSFSVSGGQMAIQPDGKIIVAGLTQYGPTGFIAVRYNADGSLDNTFGFGGIVINHFSIGIGTGTSSERSQSIALQSDGKILIGGTVTISSKDNMALVRYKSNGSIDSTFGSSGIAITDFGGSRNYGYAIAVKPDGRILQGGLAKPDFGNNTYSDSVVKLIQFTNKGRPDSTFGVNGIAFSSKYFSNGTIGITDLAIQGDGKIVASAYTDNPQFSNFEAFRFMSNGFIDSSFGKMGRAFTNLSGTANSLSLQKNGKIVLTGYTIVGNMIK